MESQQATCCCSKRFGFFRLSHELSRRTLSDTTPCSVCVNSHTAVYGESAGYMLLLETVRLFPAVTRTFTKDIVRHNTVFCVNSHTAVYGESAGYMVLLETVRLFPAVKRTFTKRPQHNSVCVTKIQLSKDSLQATFIHSFSYSIHFIPEIHQSGYRTCH